MQTDVQTAKDKVKILADALQLAASLTSPQGIMCNDEGFADLLETLLVGCGMKAVAVGEVVNVYPGE